MYLRTRILLFHHCEYPPLYNIYKYPSVHSAMPDFHAKMKDKLRSVEQGADTVVWLAISAAATSAPSGKFWQDRDTAAAHLPLAWTKSSQQDRDKFMKILEDIKQKIST